jgi:hypothetical protein
LGVPGSDGLSTGAPTTGPGGATSGPGALPPGTVPGTGPGGGPQPVDPGQTTGPALPNPTAGLGPGVTDNKVYVGLIYCSDCAAGNAALGGAGGQDERNFYKPLIEYVNKHGGVAGRTLTPVYAELRATSSEPIDSQYQAACAKFTEDNKVFIMTTQNEIGWSCAQKNGTVAIGSGAATGPMYAKYPQLIDAAGIRLERIGSLTVGGLAHQNYFTGWSLQRRVQTAAKPKVGIISWENPSYKYSMDHGWLPALRAQGYDPEVAYVKVPEAFSGLGNSSAAVSSAVFRFQSKGIDHVLINDGPAGVFAGTGLTLLFLSTAESQRYYPRYGFNSYNSPAWENHPADQERGMLAVSWTDTMPEDDAEWHQNPARQKCWKILRAAGVQLDDDISMTIAAGTCDWIFLMDRGMQTKQNLTVAGFIKEATSFGTSYQSPFVYLTRLAPDQRDGVNGVRNSKYLPGCNCMDYTSDPYTP